MVMTRKANHQGRLAASPGRRKNSTQPINHAKAPPEQQQGVRGPLTMHNDNVDGGEEHGSGEPQHGADVGLIDQQA
jgi:hypothetical protein